jgi:hypothetical protein
MAGFTHLSTPAPLAANAAAAEGLDQGAATLLESAAVKRFLSAVAMVLVAACRAAPTPVLAPAALPPIASTPVAVPSVARWLRISGATMIGPEVPGGTLVLLGGRRAIVALDGTVREELAPLPQPLVDIVEVPTAHGARLIALGPSAIFRLDEPLGEPKLLATLDRDSNGKRLGSGPGYVAVWKEGMGRGPSFLDVDTGQPVRGPPGPPVSAMAFRNANEGAAIFTPSGLAVTRDGGATWRPVLPRHSRGEQPAGVEVSGGVLRVVTETGAGADLDVGTAAVAPPSPRTVQKGAPLLLRWIEATHEDPRAAAISAGVPFGEGSALVARDGLLARVDLGTGAVLELADQPVDPKRGWCFPARTGETLWLGCAKLGRTSLSVYALDAGAKKLELRGPIVAGDLASGSNDQRAARSPSGGVTFAIHCHAGEEGWCTLQPDGAWRSVRVPRDGWKAALADGRLAYLSDEHWYWDPHKEVRVIAADSAGQSRPLSPIPFPAPAPDDGLANYELVGASMEEGTDHVVRFLVVKRENKQAVYVVAQPLDGRPAQVLTLDGAIGGMLRGGYGLVFYGDGRASITVDGGVTWTDVGLPKNERWTVWDREWPLDEVGLHWGDWIRVGWQPGAAPAEPRLEDKRPFDAPAAVRTARLTCTSGARASGEAHGIPSAGSGRKLAPGRGRHEAHVAIQGEAAFDAEAPDARSPAPTKWTLRWFDPIEVGAHLRSWTGKPPEGAAWGARTLWYAVASGDEAMLRIGGGVSLTPQDWLVRVTRGGSTFAHPLSAARAREVLAPPHRGAPAVWIESVARASGEASTADEGLDLVVWGKGEAPRAVARLRQTHDDVEYVLGAPGPASVPLMVLDRRQRLAAIREVPLAAPPAGEPPYLPIEGWTQTDAPRHVGALGACGAGPGMVFDVTFASTARPLEAWSVSGPALRASFEGELDGVPFQLSAGTVRLRFAGASACLELLAGSVRGRGDAAEGLVRLDLMHARGEVRAPSAKGSDGEIRAVKCAITPAQPEGG